MNIRPLHDRVIVKRVEAERTTAAGIVIPDTAGEKPDQDRGRLQQPTPPERICKPARQGHRKDPKHPRRRPRKPAGEGAGAASGGAAE